ncbi:acyltransferase family protein [Aeromonas veronii]
MIASIQYLRGVAALLVVFYHLRGLLSFPIGTIPNLGDFLFSQGYIGVDLFFLISGFVIVLSTEKDSLVSSFISKRFFRIYPLYAFCLLSVLFLSSNNYTPSQITRAALLIHSNYSDVAPWFGYSIVQVAWTISYEILFYVIFCASMSISHKYRVALSSFFIAVMIYAINLFFGGTASLNGYYSIQPSYGVLRFMSSPMLYEFIVGMMVALFYINKEKFDSIRFFVPALSSVGVMYFILFYFSSGISGFGHGLSNSGIAAFSLFLSLLLIEVFYGFRESRILKVLGDLSYSIYLNQAIVSAVSSHVIGAVVIVGQVGSMLIQVFLILTLSIITYFYIEKPSVAVARKVITIISNLAYKQKVKDWRFTGAI